MIKKSLALALTVALTASLAVLPAQAAAFPDISDPQVAQAAELLRQLDIVSGKPGGTFDPDGVFTRAEFCKMALVALDREQEARLQGGRVIFSDVTAGHWALAYINAAAAVKEGSTPLVRGKGDGRFEPDASITGGEAVTILMRCLGYTDADVGGDGTAWYSGHMLRAADIGLLDGLDGLQGGAPLTRAQAALLFENLLFTPAKGSEKVFLETVLGGSVTEADLILEVKGKALSAGGWALQTAKASYQTLRDDLDPEWRGRQAKLVLDDEGRVLALQADEDYTTRTLRILSAEARYVVTDDDEQVLIPTSTPLWKADQTQDTYGSAYKEITYGTTAVLCYDKADALVSVYLLGRDKAVKTAVAKEGSRPFDQLLAGASVQVYHNGLASSLNAVRPYDVGVYDSQAGVLNVTDYKLTGIYENADPSPVSPDKITVMGHAFPVLDSALKDLVGYKLGDPMTLLLTADNEVAGVVSPQVASGQALGTAVITKGEPDARGRDTFTAKVTLPSGIILSGKVHSNDSLAAQAPGHLYSVTSSQLGSLTLTLARSASAPGSWDVSKGLMGGVKVSPQAAVYDKTPTGAMTLVDLDAVTAATVPASRISLVHMDSAGTVDCIVLNDVTGDCYTYGLVSFTAGYGGSSSDMSSYVNPSTTVTNGGGSLKLTSGSTFSRLDGKFMGLAAPLSVNASARAPLSSVDLQSHADIPRSDFAEKTVTVGDTVYPLAGNIDQCCYNAVSETWFPSLDAALAYSGHLTVYVDRAPDQGGKVRLVVVEE